MKKPILFRGKAVTMPQWQQLLDQYHEEGKGRHMYTRSVWANTCIEIRSALLSKIEWEIGTPGDEFMPSEGHPLWDLLEMVNPENNWIDHIRATEIDMLLTGTAYWLKAKNLDFIQRLNPTTMEVIANRDGLQGFKQTLPDGPVREFPREDIVYFHTYHPDNDFAGIGNAEVCKTAIDAEANANAYLADFFANYAIPPVLLRTEQIVPQEEGNAIVQWWNDKFGGKGDRHKVGLVDKGLEAQILGYPIKDLELSAIRDELRKDICAAFGVPMSIAGAWESATYQSAPEQRQSLYTETIIPRADYMRSVINAELIWPADPRVEFRWKYEEIDALQEDRNSESERIVAQFEAGIISLDAAVDLLGYDPDMKGEGKPEPPTFGGNGGPAPEDTPFRADLGKWQRKAVWRLEKDGSPYCDFTSEHIDPSLAAAIEGRLQVANTKSDISRIFQDAMSYPFHAHSREDEVNASEFVKLFEMMMANQKAVQIKADNVHIEILDPSS